MITIKGIKYRVIPIIQETPEDGIFVLGKIDIPKALIGIRVNETDEQVQKSSFMHEIIHGIMPSDMDDEQLVDILGSNLYAFLVDNDLLKDGWWDNILDEHEEGLEAINVDYSVRELDGTAEEGVAG